MLKFDMETLGYITALEEESGAEVTDCIKVGDNEILYIVKNGHIGRALGKQGANVKKIGDALGKRIRVVELSTDPIKFTKDMLRNMETRSISLDSVNKTILIQANHRTRGAILGKDGEKVQILKDLLKRHHGIEDVSVK